MKKKKLGAADVRAADVRKNGAANVRKTGRQMSQNMGRQMSERQVSHNHPIVNVTMLLAAARWPPLPIVFCFLFFRCCQKTPDKY